MNQTNQMILILFLSAVAFCLIAAYAPQTDMASQFQKIAFPIKKENEIKEVGTIISDDRFYKTPCKSIIDRKTQLEWYMGPNNHTTWSESAEWVKDLKACNKIDWRMPSIKEIKTLYLPKSKAGTGFCKGNKCYPAKMDPIFNSIGNSSWIWSNKQSKNNPKKAYFFNMYIGKPVRIKKDGKGRKGTVYPTRVFAVRNK